MATRRLFDPVRPFNWTHRTPTQQPPQLHEWYTVYDAPNLYPQMVEYVEYGAFDRYGIPMQTQPVHQPPYAYPSTVPYCVYPAPHAQPYFSTQQQPHMRPTNGIHCQSIRPLPQHSSGTAHSVQSTVVPAAPIASNEHDAINAMNGTYACYIICS